MSPHLEQDKIWMQTLTFNLSSLSSYSTSWMLKINWKSTVPSLHSCDSLNPSEALVSGCWVPSFPTCLDCTKQTCPRPATPCSPKRLNKQGDSSREVTGSRSQRTRRVWASWEVFLAIVLICIFTVIQTFTPDPRARLSKKPRGVYPLSNVCAFVEILQKQMEEVCQSNGWTINPVPCR